MLLESIGIHVIYYYGNTVYFGVVDRITPMYRVLIIKTDIHVLGFPREHQMVGTLCRKGQVG